MNKKPVKIFFLITAVLLAGLAFLVFSEGVKKPEKLSGKEISIVKKRTKVITIKQKQERKDTTQSILQNKEKVNVDNMLAYAASLLGKPYVYACSDPDKGFDCSGFVSHVFGKYGIELPRSSSLYIDLKPEIPITQAKRGDILVFTGTTNFDDKTNAGHLGIVYASGDTIKFIHSSSGKAMGVTITPLAGNYVKRFIKVVRVLPQNNQ